MPRRRYNWVIRTLENWSDHWLRAARAYEIQTAPQLWDRIREGRAGKSSKPHMKMPSKIRITESKEPNLPIMDDWLRQVHFAIREFLTEQEQKVVFQRYFGHEYGKHHYRDWAKECGMELESFRQHLKRAHQILGDELDYTKHLRA